MKYRIFFEKCRLSQVNILFLEITYDESYGMIHVISETARGEM